MIPDLNFQHNFATFATHGCELLVYSFKAGARTKSCATAEPPMTILSPQTPTTKPSAPAGGSDSSKNRQEIESMLYGYGNNEDIEDNCPLTDWCRANRWNSVRDCLTCRGSGQYYDYTPCPDCYNGMVGWP